MQYLKISNHTEIDENAFKLIGACTKRDDDSKIGYFGSGLKYALAVLLRENIAFRVFSGKKEIKMTVNSEVFRGQAFNIISVCGKETSLTTSMGVDWKPWQAVREIFCNALDEAHPSREIVDTVKPEKGITAFYIPTENSEIQFIVDNWDKYFAHDRRPLVGDCCKIYSPICDTVNIYRKGIRCWDESYASLYDYDFDTIRITESRSVEYTFEIWEGMAKLWGKYATTQMIDALLALGKTRKSDATYAEDRIDWGYAHFSDLWREYFAGQILVPSNFAGWFPDITSKSNAVIVPDKLLRMLKKQFKDDIATAMEEMDAYGEYCTTKYNERQAFLLKECMQFFDEVKLNIPYDIKLGMFKNKDILGSAQKGCIILSAKVFDMGKKQIVSTIMEECAHLESEQPDKSRGFQNYLINQIITMLENQYCIFL